MPGASADGPAPFFSIVTPALNCREYLRICLCSIDAQSERDFEHIVVDGASTDGTIEMLASWAGHRVQWLSERDSGQAAALNKGFARARGNVIAWLNADDVYEPWTLERARHHFEADPGLDLLYGYALVIDARGEFLRVAPEPRPQLSDLLLFSNFLHQPAVFFRRALIDVHGGLDESLYFTLDYEYWLRLARHVKALRVPEVLARIRMRPGSKMADPGWRRFSREMRAVYLRHGGRRFSPMLLERVVNRWIEYPLFMATWPARKLLWRLMGVPWGQPFRRR